MDHFQYLFKGASEADKDILIALLSEIGFDGFEEAEGQLIGFTTKEIPSADIDKIVSLTSVTYFRSVVKEINWNEAWEKDFKPVTVFLAEKKNAFVHIRAHFHPPAGSSDHEIIITPKMSFGTGHHDTTHGMIECMSQIDFTDKSVIDFGTGTGVLAILAEKLGAAVVIALDNDEWSIRNAKENIIENGCTKIQLRHTDHFISDTKADIILANINLNVILDNIGFIAEGSDKNTVIVLSGMLEDDKPLITDALKKCGINIGHIYVKNNWMIIMAGNMY